MALKDRLSTLRRQAGNSPGPIAPSGMGIAERVARARPSQFGHPGSAGQDRSVAALVQGQVLAPGVILIERRVSLATHHGAFCLAQVDSPPTCAPLGQGIDPRRMAFLDTETTGLSGGTGTVVFLLGLARIDAHSLVVRQYLLTAFAGEAELLRAAQAWMQGAAALVSFNGKSFDVPLLASRCRLAGLHDSFSALSHIDLLYPTRRAYASRWEDCRLQTAERRLLRFARKNDLPGAEAPAAWFAFIHSGDAGRLPAVARHNLWDLLSLAVLLPALVEVYARPAACDADVLAVARAHLANGGEARGFALLDEHREMLDAAGLLELARIHRRRKEWEQACCIWERLAGSEHPQALECLAKYHEHVQRDYPLALRYAGKLPAKPRYDVRKKRLAGKTLGANLDQHAVDFKHP